MNRLILIFIFMFTVAAIPFDTGVVQQKSYKKGAYESVDNINKILLYCNTKEFIKNMEDNAQQEVPIEKILSYFESED